MSSVLYCLMHAVIMKINNILDGSGEFQINVLQFQYFLWTREKCNYTFNTYLKAFLFCFFNYDKGYNWTHFHQNFFLL